LRPDYEETVGGDRSDVPTSKKKMTYPAFLSIALSFLRIAKLSGGLPDYSGVAKSADGVLPLFPFVCGPMMASMAKAAFYVS
jgi:hypothetical protein